VTEGNKWDRNKQTNFKQMTREKNKEEGDFIIKGNDMKRGKEWK
jgi:hypothetical protein